MPSHYLWMAAGAQSTGTYRLGFSWANQDFGSKTVTLACDSLSPPRDVDSMYTTWEPALYENSRIPWRLLWESAPRMYVPFFVKGKDSPTSFIAAVALEVKITVYSGGARKNASTLSRASLTQSALN